MNDFLDIYTRLKMKTDSDVIVTYYSINRQKNLNYWMLLGSHIYY